MAIGRIFRRRPILRRIRGQEVEEAQGSFLEIYDDHIDVYAHPEAAFPSRTVDYFPDIGCNITGEAREITTVMTMKNGILQMESAGAEYVVRKTSEGGAVIEAK